MSHYQDPDEWTDFSDVGNIVSIEEYTRIETAYIYTAIDFISNDGIDHLNIIELEDYDNKSNLIENEQISIKSLKSILQSLLRGEFWCKLETKDGFIHVGHDFYMYIGVTKENLLVKNKAKDSGLFVETFISPYNK